MILCIETATALCSVALCDSGHISGIREDAGGRSHASRLTVLIQELLSEQSLNTSDLEAVAVSKGPGSYTGLRIGVSVAKGIAYASSIPIIGIDTTMSMYRGFLENAATRHSFTGTDLFCPVLDARRMEVYYSVFDAAGTRIKETAARIIDSGSFSEYPDSQVIYFFGEGASKINGVIRRKNALFDEEFRISAASMKGPAYEAFKKGAFEDVAYFEPFYLKDFLITKPVKNVLRK